MMKKLFILACVCLLITSCNSNSKNTNDSATSMYDDVLPP